MTDDSNYGLLLFNNGTVCDIKSHGILATTVATSICKVMGYDSAGYMDRLDKPHWRMQQSFETSMYDISCPDKYDDSWSWYSCTYKVGSNEKCLMHRSDVFLKCRCQRENKSCSKGMYFTDDCLCTKCPRDTYKDIEGPESFCKNCPKSSTSSPGSAYCTCLAGYYWNEGKCHLCPKGSVSKTASLECVKCPLDSSAVNQGTACKCPTGQGWSWEGDNQGECRLCLPGTYLAGDMTSCQPCPRHTTSDVGSDHCICPAGKFWNSTKCQNCDQGSVSPSGALRCQTCPTYFSSNGTVCECPNGEVWSWDSNKMGSCILLDLKANARVELLLRFSVGLIVLIFSLIATVIIVLLIKKMKRDGRNSGVNVLNIPYAE